MAFKPFQMGKQSKGDRSRKWYKRMCNKALRRQGKLRDEETDLAPKRAYHGRRESHHLGPALARMREKLPGAHPAGQEGAWGARAIRRQ